MSLLWSHPPRRERPRVLRDYQRVAIDDVTSHLSKRNILVSPTGSGKTFMASALVRELALPTLWLAHRTELIEQAARSLRENGLYVGVIKAGIEPDRAAPVQVASIQTLTRRTMPPAELVVVDEAHHCTGASYGSVLAQYPDAAIVGLTATPFRLDGRGLGDIFGRIVVSAHAADLVASGVLHAPLVYATKPPDLRGVKSIGGDYNLTQLAQRMTPETTCGVVKAWQDHASDKKTVAFAVDVEHSKSIAAAFAAAGVSSEHLDGSTPADERAAILRKLATGQVTIVSNCMVLTVGWDLPALECAILARPTASLNLHLQMIGRVMRACPGKDGAIVLDHAGNHHVHGLVTRRLEYHLDGSIKTGSAEPLGLRQCAACFVLYESNLPACPHCGCVPEPAERQRPEIDGAGSLTRLVEDFEYRRSIWNLIEAERDANGYKPAWSLFRFEDRFGHRPVTIQGKEFRELIDPKNATMAEKEAVYAELIEVAEEKGFAAGWASHRYKESFGVWPRGFVSRTKISAAWAEKMGVGA